MLMNAMLKTLVSPIVKTLLPLIVGVVLAYWFYWLAITHRKWYIFAGFVLVILGCFLYGMGGASTDANRHCNAAAVPTNSVVTVASSTNAVASVSILYNATGMKCKDISISFPTNSSLEVVADTNMATKGFTSEVVSCLASVNKSLSSFFPSRGGYDDGGEGVDGGMAICYWLFHYFALLYMVSIFAAIFGVEIINGIKVDMKYYCTLPRLQLRFKRAFRPNALNVFWDACDEACMLCENALAAMSPSIKKNSIVFVLSETSRSWFRLKDDDNVVRKLMRKGWTWIVGDVERPYSLIGASRHFFLGPDGHENVSRAESLLKQLEKKVPNLHCGKHGAAGGYPGISVYVRAWPEADDDILYKWADEWNRKLVKNDICVAVEIVREECIASRRFLLDHPMLDCPDVKVDTVHATVSGEFRLLVLGFGVQGERLMSDMICDAQFVEGKNKSVPIFVDVVDSSHASFGWFKENCRDAVDRYNIKFSRMDVRSPFFWQWLERKERAYNRIVICTQDDALNVSLANDIANYYGVRFRKSAKTLRDTIFARARKAELARSLKDSLDEDSRSYRIFGSLEDIYTEEALLNDRWNDGAIVVNGIWNVRYEKDYKKGSDPLEYYKTHGGKAYGWRCWRATSTFNRESSRAALFHQRNLLRLMGYGISAVNDGCTTCDPVELARVKTAVCDDSHLNNLSESEHMRWMAFHFVRGWKRWNPSRDEIEQLAVVKKRVEPSSMKRHARLHAALVDFDKLGKVDAAFNAVNKMNGMEEVHSAEKDDDIVYGLDAIFESGFTVIKEKGEGNGISA